MFRRLRIASAALLLLLCSCQQSGQNTAAESPVPTSTPGTTIENAAVGLETPQPTPEATADPPAMLVNGSEYSFGSTNIDEFEMFMLDQTALDTEDKEHYSLFYYMPVNIPEGFTFRAIECGSSWNTVKYLGPSLIYEGKYSSYLFRTIKRSKEDFLVDLNSQVDSGTDELINWNGQDYYVSKIISVSPDDDDDTPGIKPQYVTVIWYDNAVNQIFQVWLPNLTSFDPSLFRYCEFKTVVIDPERIDRLRSELLKNYTHEFPVNPERIAAEADFAARDYDTFIEMFRQRADIREAYKCPLTKYKPIWQPPGYELEQICCGRLGRAFLYRKGTSSIIHMAYNRYRNDFLRQLQQYENEGRMERHELEHINGCCYVMASELSAGIDIYRYDERWKQAIYVHMPADEYDPSMLDLYCAFSMVEME